MDFQYSFILAGGLGTRLRSVVKDVPKPMADINGEPFLNFQIRQIRSHFRDLPIYLLTGYLSEIVEDYYREWDNVYIISEEDRLGTGGAVKHALDTLGVSSKDVNILLFNGDTYTEVDLTAFATMASSSVSVVGSMQHHCDRYGTLTIEDNRVVGFAEKEVGLKDRYINAGLYAFNHSPLFDGFSEGNVSLEAELTTEMLNGLTLGFFPYHGQFIDIGIPEDYENMQQHALGLAKDSLPG